MKKQFYFYVIFFIFFLSNIYSQKWTPLGPNDFDNEIGFSQADIHYASLDLDSADIPYVAFKDSENSISIKKFDNDSWVNVGVLGNVELLYKNIAFAIDPNGIAYVVYSKTLYDNNLFAYTKIYVKRYKNSIWEDVGSVINDKHCRFGTISIDDFGTPYIAYIDADIGFKAIGKLSVKKFDGNSWIDTGIIGNSCHYLFSVYKPTFTISKSGIPYIGYLDADNDCKITVKKFYQGSWINVGSEWDIQYTSSVDDSFSLSINELGNASLAYAISRSHDEYLIKVNIFDGASWVDVSNAGGSIIRGNQTSLTTDSSGTLYLAYNNTSNQDRASVIKFNGSSWEDVGVGISAESVSDISIETDASGNLVLIYCSNYLYAKKYNTNALAIENFNESYILLYPNPVKDYFNIDLGQNFDKCNVEIYDLLGRSIYKNILYQKVNTFNTESFASGIYNIRLNSDNKQVSKRFIKQ